MTVVVYFSRAEASFDCSAVFPVKRKVPATRAVARAALSELFAGPTQRESELGYRSPFSAATRTSLRGLRIVGGTAYVDLNDRRDQLAGATSSCGAAELKAQISRTLRQFKTVRRVIVAIEGQPRTFYEWLSEPCDKRNDQCDDKPFR